MIPRIDVSALAVPEGKSVQEMVAIYKNNKNVVFAEPNYFATITWLPDDPYYAACQTALKIMSPEPAWSISTGSPAVPVAILDTGATFNHEDLSGKYLLGYDFVNNDNDPTDDQGHGTMVSGIIGANTNNSLGIAGAAGSASLLPVKVMDNNGSGTWSNVALGIIFAADKGAKVINMSLGGPTDSSTVKSAVDYAYNKGVVLVASAGNSNSAVEYPAAYPNVISVSAVDNYDEKAGFSNYGPEVDFTAPGYSIYTTKYNSSYCFGSGTSFSAPFVSALAELIMTVIPGCTPAQVVDIMKQGAKDLGTPGWDCYYGYGRVDYAAALSIAAGQTPVEDTTKPVITLNGSPSVTITAGETYIDAGAAAVDNIDGDITSKIVVNNTVNTSIPGTYIVTYNVADAAGNQADQVTRTVTVIEPAPTPAKLTFSGSIGGKGQSTASKTLNINKDGTLSLSLSWNVKQTDLDLYLYDSANTLIAGSKTSTSKTNTESITSPVTTGIYTVKIISVSGKTNYTLTAILP